jgi:hypothetical protein
MDKIISAKCENCNFKKETMCLGRYNCKEYLVG